MAASRCSSYYGSLWSAGWGSCGACSFGGLSFQLLAIQQAPVGVVETVKRGMVSAMALLVGRAVFAERLPPHRIGAALLMAGGVACILI